MSVFEMWRSTLAIKILLVVIGFMVFSFGITGLWVGIGIALLLAGALMVFRQGQSAGHEACAASKSVAAIGADKADKKMLSQMWSVSNGVRSIFAGAAVSYTINAIYIILSVVHAPEIATFISRLVSWVITMPYWPIIAAWHETYEFLTTDVILVLMISPFILPLVQFAGYMQGPKLWKKTEQAMVDGRRRAKARSRIVKKNKLPRSMRPEI
ncbi:MAG: hypothetical protein MR371_04795 [Clostridia bacterium]|nr:hypothetical protein [Clostridia bacterium]